MDSKLTIKNEEESAMATNDSSFVAGDSSNLNPNFSAINGESLVGEPIFPQSLTDSTDFVALSPIGDTQVFRNIFGEILVKRRIGSRPLSVFNEPWWSKSKELDDIFIQNGASRMVLSFEEKVKDHKDYLLLLGLHCPAVQRWLKEQVHVFFLSLNESLCVEYEYIFGRLVIFWL